MDTTVPSDYTLSVNAGALFTNTTTVSLTVGTKPGIAEMQLSNDGGFSGIAWEPYASRKNWTITQFGSYVIPRVVYARFRDVNGAVSATVQDDIILDVTPPSASISVLGGSSRSTSVAVTLNLSATDDVSGVDQMAISNSSVFAGVPWETYSDSRSADITIASKPQMALDGPTNNSIVVQPFITGGWATDLAASVGSGVDAVHVWAFPTDGTPARFVDAATLGGTRLDVGAVFGSQFNNAGFNFLMTSLTTGTYDLGVYVHSTVAGTFNQQRFVRITVAPSGSEPIPASSALVARSESIAAYAPTVETPTTGNAIEMSVDVPQAGNARGGPLVLAGWALDRAAETNSGIGGIHVWAVRRSRAMVADLAQADPGDAPVFLGVAESDVSRPDVAAVFGAQFDRAGWQLTAPRLAPGEYDLIVYAWSARTGRFETSRTVAVVIQ